MSHRPGPAGEPRMERSATAEGEMNPRGDRMPTRREARLRHEFGPLYPAVPQGQWRPVQEMIDMVAVGRINTGRRSGDFLAGRPLDERHFEFRGGFIRPPGRHTRLVDVEGQR